MPSTESFLRQISRRERDASKPTSTNMFGMDNASMSSSRKRVMVVVDHTSQSNNAALWALTHVANKADVLTLLHVITNSSSSSSSFCAISLGSLCKASTPEVEVEVLVMEGPKLATVLNQVKKLEVSVLVLGQKRPSFLSYLCGIGGAGDLVEQCINNAECLTIGVRKQSRDMGGYVINTRWHNNFWLLA